MITWKWVTVGSAIMFALSLLIRGASRSDWADGIAIYTIVWLVAFGLSRLGDL